MSGTTARSKRSTTSQSSHTVMPIGAVTTTPVKKYVLRRARRPRLRGG